MHLRGQPNVFYQTVFLLVRGCPFTLSPGPQWWSGAGDAGERGLGARRKRRVALDRWCVPARALRPRSPAPRPRAFAQSQGPRAPGDSRRQLCAGRAPPRSPAHANGARTPALAGMYHVFKPGHSSMEEAWKARPGLHYMCQVGRLNARTHARTSRECLAPCPPPPPRALSFFARNVHTTHAPAG